MAELKINWGGGGMVSVIHVLAYEPSSNTYGGVWRAIMTQTKAFFSVNRFMSTSFFIWCSLYRWKRHGKVLKAQLFSLFLSLYFPSK